MDRAGSADRLLAAGLSLAAFAFLMHFQPFSRPLVLDPATWDLMSVRLGQGLIPYRDIFLHKTPGALFFGAAGAMGADSLGLRPVAGAHGVYLLLGAMGPALLYLVCRRTMSRPAALTAALMMVAIDQWPAASLEGVRPKVATTTLGLSCLLAASMGRPAAAGVLGASAMLCWQPGLAFLVGAAWTLGRGREARRKILALSLGTLVPVLSLLVWLVSQSALGDFMAQSLGFNLDYIAHHARSPASTLARIWRLAWAWNRPECLLALPAVAALAWTRFGQKTGRATATMPRGLAAMGFSYLAMAFLSFQAWPDTILLVPVVAALVAAGIHALADLLPGPAAFAKSIPVIAALGLALSPQSSRLEAPIDFDEQAFFMKRLASGLEADARVLVVSLPEFELHTGFHSVWPWPYLWFGVDRFASDHSNGGFDSLLAGLDSNKPDLMLVARRWSGPLRARFENWASTRYSRRRLYFFPHTRRPINVYRRLSEAPS